MFALLSRIAGLFVAIITILLSPILLLSFIVEFVFTGRFRVTLAEYLLDCIYYLTYQEKPSQNFRFPPLF
jgi:hypothetical protein